MADLQRTLAVLADYERRHRSEAEVVRRIRALLQVHGHEAFERRCSVGHVTASAWIVDREHRCFLLTHHRKLERWLQVGGHVDGEDPYAGCLREAAEESGIEGLEFVGPRLDDGQPAPFDLDVHRIPARKAEPAHEHHDFRYLLRAPAGAVPRAAPDESLGVDWFTDASVKALLAVEESLHRMWRKARPILDSIAD